MNVAKVALRVDGVGFGQTRHVQRCPLLVCFTPEPDDLEAGRTVQKGDSVYRFHQLCISPDEGSVAIGMPARSAPRVRAHDFAHQGLDRWRMPLTAHVTRFTVRQNSGSMIGRTTTPGYRRRIAARSIPHASGDHGQDPIIAFALIDRWPVYLAAGRRGRQNP